jgi:hypothetical protein
MTVVDRTTISGQLIEREAEYIADIKRRIALALFGRRPPERVVIDDARDNVVGWKPIHTLSVFACVGHQFRDHEVSVLSGLRLVPVDLVRGVVHRVRTPAKLRKRVFQHACGPDESRISLSSGASAPLRRSNGTTPSIISAKRAHPSGSTITVAPLAEPSIRMPGAGPGIRVAGCLK